MSNDKLQKQSRSIANSSGFPLQIRIAEIVRSSSNWRVILEEHPWSSAETQSENFIDIIIEGKYDNFQVMVIECKRVRQAEWVFLIPHPSPRKSISARIWESAYINTVWRIYEWTDSPAEPESYESKFCSIQGQESGRKTLLERTAAELVDSIEALANQEKNFKRDPAIFRELSFRRVYIPVIVTTAELKVAFFEPSSISLTDGSLPPDTHFETVSYVRFRKSLAGNIVSKSYQSLEDVYEASERIVFVVNAEGFSDFLKKWQFK